MLKNLFMGFVVSKTANQAKTAFTCLKGVKIKLLRSRSLRQQANTGVTQPVRSGFKKMQVFLYSLHRNRTVHNQHFSSNFTGLYLQFLSIKSLSPRPLGFLLCIYYVNTWAHKSMLFLQYSEVKLRSSAFCVGFLVYFWGFLSLVGLVLVFWVGFFLFGWFFFLVSFFFNV